MGKVFEIGICKNKGEKILKIQHVEAVKGKGLINDRKYKDNNSKLGQITLIEIENINYFNLSEKTSISPLDFRRNIISEGVDLNSLVGKEFFIGEVKVKSHNLCRPCKYLQNLLSQNNFLKKMMHKSGIRCEILSNGIINADDKIKY